MAQVTRHSTLRPLAAQVRDSFARVAYSHKTHEKCADIFHARLTRLKVAQIVLSAITTGGLIAFLFGDSRLAIGIATITSTILLIINAYTKESDLGQLGQKHAATASSLWSVRERYLALVADIQTGTLTVQEIRERRDQLQKNLEAVYATAPRTIDKAYNSAQKALKLNEELTFTPGEIDLLLPADLREG